MTNVMKFVLKIVVDIPKNIDILYDEEKQQEYYDKKIEECNKKYEECIKKEYGNLGGILKCHKCDKY
jgi:hypothetical protein